MDQARASATEDVKDRGTNLPTPDSALVSATIARVQGHVVVYRLFDLGYEIDLDRVFTLLGDSAPERARPVRGEAQAIQIPNPPVTASLGTSAVTVAGETCVAELSARIFDFGVVSLRARVEPPRQVAVDEFIAWGVAAANAVDWREVFRTARRSLDERISPAVTKPGESPVAEDYVVFRIHRLKDEGGAGLPATALSDETITQLLTGETRSLSAAARRDLMSQRFSYFDDDLAVLTWNAALVVEPVAEDNDIQYVLEFANAQLLELRYYDALLDQEVPRMYDRIEEARHGFHLLGRRYSALLAGLQGRVAEVTELVERSDNALKMTDDVFLARIYGAALEIFRGRTWRQGIDAKLAIVRDAYAMLNAESQARRGEVLELVIIALILLEVVLALVRR
jgi:hypothetical protein